MGFADTLMFWKRKEPDFGATPLPSMGNLPDPKFDTGLDSMGMDKGFDMAPLPPLPPQNFNQNMNQGMNQSQMPMRAQNMMLEPVQQRMNDYSMQNQQEIIMNKNMEIISSKIDALQASLDSISQRIANIERIANHEQQRTMQKRYGY